MREERANTRRRTAALTGAVGVEAAEDRDRVADLLQRQQRPRPRASRRLAPQRHLLLLLLRLRARHASHANDPLRQVDSAREVCVHSGKEAPQLLAAQRQA
jgi:hypothetical protein